ncbi:uncharacterized protein [Amphiura filiformis]|uniref:uncharacterized protein isoform X2 n=1 Tax=Amphiura filiformis TaxID=82378 RepID=UPI003B21C8DA
MATTTGYPGPPGSPLRSLSSFKSELGLQMEDPAESGPKSFHQYLDLIINGIPLQSLVLLLVCLDCLLVSSELLLSFNMIDNVSIEANEEMVGALSATSLAIVSLFVLEVVTRIFTYGTVFRKHNFEVFDSLVVFITFLLDLIFFVSGLEDVHPELRALTFLIILRLWRFYGIYHVEINRAKEDAACDLQMEKYARRQAEAQSDILRNNCDQQLKEIAYLRDFIRQHSLDPSDSLKSELITPVSSPLPTLTDIHYDKTDTLRANGRLSQDTSIDDSTSSPTKERSSSIADNNENPSSSPPSPPSSPAKSRSSTDKFGSLASRESVPHEHITEVKVHIANETEIYVAKEDNGCYTNKGFEDGGSINSLQDSVLASVDQESIASTAMRTDGTGSYTNPAFELESSITRQDSGVGHETQMYRPLKRKESSEKDEDEKMLRLELDEIRRLSEEALKSELALMANNTITDENGIPTTSL